MAAASLVKYLYLAHFSRPEAERRLHRTLRKFKVSTVVELGLGSGLRAARMIAVAQRYTRLGGVSYTGIDMFEARPRTSEGPTLKQAHKLLVTSGARLRLVPGDPYSALARTANELGGTDLLVLSADLDVDSMARAWFYVPRLLHPRSVVLRERRDGAPKGLHQYEPVTLDEIKQLAKIAAPRRAA